MKEKGIAWITLVITIIVLIILGVVVSMIINYTKFNNTVNTSQSSTNDYTQVESDEILQGIKVGDYVEYNPTQASLSEDTIELLVNNSNVLREDYFEECNLKQEKLYWRVLDIKDGKIRLISDAPTQATIDLYGYKGYNNSVYLLNLVCKELYSSDVGEAKCLSIDDIQEHLSYNYKNYEINGHKYGDTFTIDDSLNNYYPEIYLSENGSNYYNSNLGQSEQLELVNQTDDLRGSLSFTVSAWSKELKPEDFSDFKNNSSLLYDTFFENDNSTRGYILASRCVSELDELRFHRAYWGLYWIHDNNYVSQTPMYDSTNQRSSLGHSFKPIITLNENVTIQHCNGENSKENLHKIIE